MNLKTFTADTMAGAIALVKKELGAGAVILHTRTYLRGGFLGIGRKRAVQVMAADGVEVAAQRRRATASKGREGTRNPGPKPPAWRAGRGEPGHSLLPAIAAGLSASRGGAEDSAGVESASGSAQLIRRTYAAAREDYERSSPASATALSPSKPGSGVTGSTTHDLRGRAVASNRRDLGEQTGAAATAVLAEPVAAGASATQPVATAGRQWGPDVRQMNYELQAVRRLVGKVVRQQQRQGRGRRSTPELPGTLMEHYLALLEQELSDDLVEQVVSRVRSSLAAGDMEDGPKVKAALREAMMHILPRCGVAAAPDSPAPAGGAEPLAPTTDGRPRIITLIGPTGVGKTTTIAKLAAEFRLRQKKKVGLITLDTYRIAAVDQLRTYANIIGVPLRVATTADELRAALRQCAAEGCEVVLMDTAGRSQKDDPKLDELAALVGVADPHEVHLVLSSTCTQRVLEDAVQRFSRVRVDRMIFTKLDEAVSFGVLVNVARKADMQLSYVTTGQDVPRDIETCHAERLAGLVLGDRL